MTDLDHLVVAVPELGAAMDGIEAAVGIRPEFGGAHEGLGTHNALLSLGDAYLELIAADLEQPEPAQPRPFAIDTLSGTALVTFAVHPRPGTTIESVVHDLRTAGHDPGPIIDMHRVRPDGERLDWRLTLPDPAAGGVVPFIIDWGDTVSPSRTAPGGASLTSFDIGLAADSHDARSALTELGLDDAVGSTTHDGLSATIEGPGGKIRFSS